MYRLPRSTAAEPTRQSWRALEVPGEKRFEKPGLRVIVLFGALALFAAPVAFLEPALHWANDPELFRLLRGMGALKGGMAAVGLFVVAWRLGQTIKPRMAAAYIAGAWSLALAAGLIWELQVIALASTIFHGAILALLVTAWRDSGKSTRQLSR